jgi:uncharacterized protein
MASRIETVEELRALYREPSQLVKNKLKASLDEVSRRFIERCPFVLVGTMGADGRLDVSPRGGPAGFLRVLSDGAIAIPDLNGNNLIDTLRAVVETGAASLLFVLPGRDETLRVNGPAFVTADPDLLCGFTQELRVPKSAIVVETAEVFVHCAKAFRRADVWNPQSWVAFADAPDAADILRCQLDLPDESEQKLRESLERSYAEGLAAD